MLAAFYLARKLSGRADVALWAMLLVAVSPWHVVFSRWAQQGIFVPLCVAAGAIALLHARRSRRVFLSLAASAVCFALAFYAYAGARPFLVLFLPMTAVVWRREAEIGKERNSESLEHMHRHAEHLDAGDDGPPRGRRQG